MAVDHDVEAVAHLGDPVRRALYRYVVEQSRPVSRDEAAAHVGIKRPLAAYHLDRLLEHGLLEVGYERPPGRGGPGAGRPAKVYTRAARDIEVTLPARRYELAARLLATALDEAGSPDVVAALDSAASRLGAEIGSAARQHRTGADTQRDAPAGVVEILAEYGYEPYEDPDGIVRVRNCPFHRLAAEHTELVCGMNLALLRGLIQELAGRRMEVSLDPLPGECCVAFRSADATPAPGEGR
jgi:predicted ArsR family transcriptional regulator